MVLCVRVIASDTERGLAGPLDAVRALLATVGAATASMPVAAGLAGELPRLLSWADELSAAGEGAAGRFEWVDGALLRAMEAGEWVVLDNANMCNPTVLDRLNPLLGTPSPISY